MRRWFCILLSTPSSLFFPVFAVLIVALIGPLSLPFVFAICLLRLLRLCALSSLFMPSAIPELFDFASGSPELFCESLHGEKVLFGGYFAFWNSECGLEFGIWISTNFDSLVLAGARSVGGGYCHGPRDTAADVCRWGAVWV